MPWPWASNHHLRLGARKNSRSRRLRPTPPPSPPRRLRLNAHTRGQTTISTTPNLLASSALAANRDSPASLGGRNATLISGRRDHGQEAAAPAGTQRAAVGAAVAVGQDGLLHRRHARLAAPRLRAAAARRAARPPPPARAPQQLPPRPAAAAGALPHLPLLPPRPGRGIPLRLLARRPPRRLRRAIPPHTLRLHRLRGRRGLHVGGRRLQRRLPLLRPRQGRRHVRRRRAPAAGQGAARRRRGHVPRVARSRRRAHRHGVPRELPGTTTPARLQNRRRSGKTKEWPNPQGTEAMHGMTLV